jgi:hypothetical protein
MELAYIFALGGYHVVGKTEIGTVVASVAGLNKVSDPRGALVDWCDLKVAQVKYDLIRDASPISPAELQPSADEMEHQ